MISENRDILVERLEQKLSEKEREINEMRDSLKESIITELRDGLKDDLDFDKRISNLENKVRDMGLAYDGVMKELLDQKTVIQDLKKNHLNNDIVREVSSPDKPKTESVWPDTMPKNDTEDIDQADKSTSNFIIAESREIPTPTPDKKDDSEIIIAERATSKSGRKGDVVVEARDDEDVVIEYKK